MKTVITISLIMLMLASGFIIISYDRSDSGVSLMSEDDYIEEVENNMEEVYQGPVPVGYNLEHFRKTGETIKEGFE